MRNKKHQHNIVIVKESDDILLLNNNNNNLQFYKYRPVIIYIFSSASCLLISYICLVVMESSYLPNIRHAANSFSSVSYALVDSPPLVRVPLFILSVASVCLWANSTTHVNFVDVTCIFWTIIAVTLNIFPNAPHKNNVLLLFDGAMIIVIISSIWNNYDGAILYYYSENLVFLTAIIYGLCGISMSAFYATNPIFLTGMGCISLGFIFKLLTIFQGQYWGTSIFHIISGLGIHILLKVKPEPQFLRNKNHDRSGSDDYVPSDFHEIRDLTDLIDSRDNA
jgi:hypothetical protein